VSEDGDSIWVAEGTYYPTETDDSDISFQMVDGVSVYGGFKGNETELSERDYVNNITNLSGDIGIKNDSSDNSTKVVVAANNLLDGIVIRDGAMNVSGMSGPGEIPSGDNDLPEGELPPESEITGDDSEESGVGHADPNSITEGDAASSENGNGIIIWEVAPTIKNCTITENSGGKGAGVYIQGNDESGDLPTFINTTISNKIASGRGGGISIDMYAEALFVDCVFDGNQCTAGKGGAIYNDYGGTPLIENCLFSNNYAQSGAALGNDGVANPIISNTTFYNNTADEAGACLYQGTGPFNDPIVIDSVMWGNNCDQDKIDVYNYNECNPYITYSVVQQGYEGEGNTSSDPLFKDAENADFSYLKNSSAVGSSSTGGDMGYKLSDKINRTEEDYETIYSSLKDIQTAGGYKINSMDISNPVSSESAVSVGSRVYVDNSKSVSGDGSSWQTAYSDLQTGIDYANASYENTNEEVEVWVKEGTYVPGESRDDHFILRSGVSVYGGFDGLETSFSERDYETNTTVLSGEIGDVEDDTDNCYHVLIGGDDATLDGFSVMDGYADGVDGEIYDSKGGGLLNYLGGERVRPDYEPTLGFDTNVENCVFEDNYASEGGATYTYHGGNPTYTNVAFQNNEAEYGAATLDRAGTNSIYTDCSFDDNYAVLKGGAAFTDYGAMSSFFNCDFNSNESGTAGGAIYAIDRASQAVANETDYALIDSSWSNMSDILSAVYVEGCNFVGNTAGTNGGAMYIYDSSVAKIVDSVFADNVSTDAAVVASYSGVVYVDSLTTFSGNSPENFTTEGTGARIEA